MKSKKAEELAQTISFEERAKRAFLLSLDHVKATLLGQTLTAEEMVELEILELSFNDQEVERYNEMGDSLNGMLRFVLHKVGIDPNKPVIRNPKNGNVWLDQP